MIVLQCHPYLAAYSIPLRAYDYVGPCGFDTEASPELSICATSLADTAIERRARLRLLAQPGAHAWPTRLARYAQRSCREVCTCTCISDRSIPCPHYHRHPHTSPKSPICPRAQRHPRPRLCPLQSSNWFFDTTRHYYTATHVPIRSRHPYITNNHLNLRTTATPNSHSHRADWLAWISHANSSYPSTDTNSRRHHQNVESSPS